MQQFPISMYDYQRRLTREVGFGPISLGGHQPIRVESMTTTHTMDTAASVEQCRRLYEAGCEIIRLTVPTEKDADNLRIIREQLRRDAIDTPLVADIHFSRKAAMKAVEHVDNIRINPGNYANRKKFSSDGYTDEEFQREQENVREEFLPLVARAKELGVSMRIGTNHGSLSDRIVSRYGNTPEGMVEAALEFARICEDEGYHDILFSMKSSNVRVMIEAYRLLCVKADAELRHAYPLHLGVTEAGSGDEGRIKSAMGIGALLEEGLGDTIRVSLTEDPVNEVPVGFALVKKYNDVMKVQGEQGHRAVNRVIGPQQGVVSGQLPPFDPFSYARRVSRHFQFGELEAGGQSFPAVESVACHGLDDPDALLEEILQRLHTDAPSRIVKSECVSVRVRSKEDIHLLDQLLDRLGVARSRVGAAVSDPALACELLDKVIKVRLDITEGEQIDKALLDRLHDRNAVIEFCFMHATSSLSVPAEVLSMIVSRVSSNGLKRIMVSVDSRDAIYAYRRVLQRFSSAGIDVPVLVRYRGRSDERLAVLIECAVQAGTLFCDGLGDMLALETGMGPDEEAELCFNILQAARVRMSKTEFISCPGCGRTYFELEKTAGVIKSRLSHLTGLKIGIMGCIVNGPGEMADADFGYVGAGKGRVSLYVGKECVASGVAEDKAVDQLIELIKSKGCWIEPISVET
jgi:(E)-4-hydroxy-3-methylbut-2-enyl-diphosphate synthase